MAPSSIEKEIKRLEGELKVKPDSLVFARLADDYRKKGNIEKAIELCTNGILKYPFYTTAKLILGKCYLEQERYAEALQTFKEICREDHRNLVAIKMAADILLRQGMIEKAGALYLILTKMDPANKTLSSMAAKYPVAATTNDLFSILEIFPGSFFSQSVGEREGDDIPTTVQEEIAPQNYDHREVVLDNVNIRQAPEYLTEDKDVIEGEIEEGSPVSGEDITNRIATLFGEKGEDSIPERESSISQVEREPEENAPVSGTDISERIEQLFSTKTSADVSEDRMSQPSPREEIFTHEESRDVGEKISFTNSIEEQTIVMKEATEKEEKILEMDSFTPSSITESSEEISGIDISERLDEIFSPESHEISTKSDHNIDLTKEKEQTLEEIKSEKNFSPQKVDDITFIEGISDASLSKEEGAKNIEGLEDFPVGEAAFGIINSKEGSDFTSAEKEPIFVSKDSFEQSSVGKVFEPDTFSGLDVEEKIEELFTDRKETITSDTSRKEEGYAEKDEIVFEEQPVVPAPTKEEPILKKEESSFASEEEKEPFFEDDFIPPEFEETLQFNGELFEQMLNPSDDAPVFVEDLIEDKMVSSVTEEMDLNSKPTEEMESSVTVFDLDIDEKDKIEPLPEMSFSFEDVMSEKSEEEIDASELPHLQDSIEISKDEMILEEPSKIEDKIMEEEITFTEEDGLSKEEGPKNGSFDIEHFLDKEISPQEQEEFLNTYEQNLQEPPMVISGSDIKDRLDSFFPESNSSGSSSSERVEKAEVLEQIPDSFYIESKDIISDEKEEEKERIEEKREDSTLEEEKTFALTSEQLEDAIKNSTKKEELETTLPDVELYEEKYENEVIENEEVEGFEIDRRDRPFEIPDHVLTPTLADIYFQQGQYELALKIYKRLLERNLDKEKIAARIEEIKKAIEQQQNAPEVLEAYKENNIDTQKKKAKQSSVKSVKKETEDSRPLAGVRINKRILNAKKKTRRKKRENN
ncbi:MAG: tetratricopeptide repeat protein [Chitinispirillaceae bacterium]|nr:tetratricopeptide repeat protein [Chitinispirillaceae bacterium]